MNRKQWVPALLIAGMVWACKLPSSEKHFLSIDSQSFGAQAWEESTRPVRPGVPGQVPFWNGAAKRFIYAPAFDFKAVPNAAKYAFEVVSEASTMDVEAGSAPGLTGRVQLAVQKSVRFVAEKPYTPLSPIWASVPVGYFTLTVTALSAEGDSLGVAGSGRYYRAAPFNGVYHEPVMRYDSSAMLALDNLLKEDYVQYWLTHHKPDPNYLNYRYPAKIYSALVIGAVTHARLKPNTPQAEQSVELARIVADFMLALRFKPGTAWEYFVPTYYGEKFNPEKKHMDPANNFTIMGVDAGHAFLDLYEITDDKKYFDAAKKIADTYAKNQMENGSWYQFVHHATNNPIAPNIVVPTAIVNYFDRLIVDYQVAGLEKSKTRALTYIMQNPVKSFNWQGQFEDVAAMRPYKNLSREQACELAMYLFRNSHDEAGHLALAEELVRFSEDQFVIWEQPIDKISKRKGAGWDPENWITPSVQEQYVFWNPVGRAAGIMVETYWEAYVATKEPIYLAKAESIANAFTLVQKEHAGDYPTFFTKYKMPLWLNSAVYPAKVLMHLEENLQAIEVGS